MTRRESRAKTQRRQEKKKEEARKRRPFVLLFASSRLRVFASSRELFFEFFHGLAAHPSAPGRRMRCAYPPYGVYLDSAPLLIVAEAIAV
jgi:hypothetical protein